jgi:divalent metal cation (Fe/Co/Zn/Cd) transporter
VRELPAARPATASPNTLDMTGSLPTAAVMPGSPQWRRDTRRALRLSWFSLAYMAAEGAVAAIAAILADSVALLGFGLDSVIEGLASVIIVWRFTGARAMSEAAELRAQRAVAVTFFLLAPYIGVEALRALLTREHADTTWLGIGLSISSLIVMPVLGLAKKRIGHRLRSPATSGEGIQNLLCAYLVAAVLAGLLANTLFGLWWLDPAVGLLIAALAVHEGREAWHGDDCY